MRTGTRLLAAVGTTAVTILSLTTPASAQGPIKQPRIVVQLPALQQDATSEALGVNDSNVTVGWSNIGDDTHAVKWASDSTPVDLGVLPGGTDSEATAINNGGTIVGSATASGGLAPAVQWKPGGSISPLDFLEGDTVCRALAINSKGVVVGICGVTVTEGLHAVRWTPDGKASKLAELPKTTASSATGINTDGAVVGWVRREDQPSEQPVRWNTDGTVTELPLLPGSTLGFAASINDRGQIAGGLWFPQGEDGAFHAILWDGASTKDLGGIPGTAKPYGVGLQINASGVVVGQAAATDGRFVGARWTVDAPVTRLATLAGADPSSVDYANAINTDGLIVGSSDGNAVRWHGYK